MDQIWNNTFSLSNAWETTFDLIEENATLNITIECWDNDEFADEWNDGPDACDMNPNDDEWRLYYEANWSNITTETFSGDGSIGNDTQWGNAESTWKVSVIYYSDNDGDGIFENNDLCPSSTPGATVDQWGCSWIDDDYDNDGLANGNDECPESSSELCGYNYTNYIIGLKKTTNELFGITNSAYNFFQPHVDHIYFTEGAYCNRWTRLDIVNESYDCTGAGQYFDYNADASLYVESLEVQTGHWATQYDVIYSPWGNYTPESYCCIPNNPGAHYFPSIENLLISGKGDFVVWYEYHVNYSEDDVRGDYFREVWFWSIHSPPMKIYSMNEYVDHQVSFGSQITLSHDGRYIIFSHPGPQSDTRVVALDIEHQSIVVDTKCIDISLAHKSNTMACQKQDEIHLISIESNETTFSFPGGFGDRSILHFSPSDKQLLSYSKDTNEGIHIWNLLTGNYQNIEIPEKEDVFAKIDYCIILPRRPNNILLCRLSKISMD